MGVKKKNRLAVNIGGIKMKNPVMVASGTFGCGEEYNQLIDINILGAVVTKTITPEPRQGNSPPRMVETASGIINSIGLQNVGIKRFLSDNLPFLKKFRTKVIVSIAGYKPEDYTKLAGLLDKEGVDGIELNISCPNVKGGGGTGAGRLFSQEADVTRVLVSRVRKATSLPLIVKLSPNVTDISKIAIGAEAGGADAISLVNTFKAMAVDVEGRKPVLANITGGLSGPAIKPIALRMVWEVARAVKIPVIGMGGIMNAKDALEFMIAGAGAVSVGTALFVDPRIPEKINRGMEDYLEKNGINDIRNVVGSLKEGKVPGHKRPGRGK